MFLSGVGCAKAFSRRLIMTFEVKKLALAVGATLVLAACGGGSKDAPKSAAAPAGGGKAGPG